MTSIVFYGMTPPSYSRSSIIYDESYEYVQCDSFPVLLSAISVSRRRSELVVITSPAHVLAILFRIGTKNQIMLDAGWPLSDADQFATDIRKKFRYLKNLIIDFCAFHSAHKIFVESDKQNIRIRRKFLVSAKKVSTRYTGVLERQFSDSGLKRVPELDSAFFQEKRPKIALFRGKLNVESGIDNLSQIARQLNPGIIIVLVTHNAPLVTSRSENLLVINRFLDSEEIAYMYRCSSLALGQLGESPRINWTIPHKFFESAYFGVPYLCLVSDSILEIVNSENVFFLKDSNPSQIAEAINAAMSDGSVLTEKGRRLRAVYDKSISNQKLVEKFKSDIAY